MTKKLYETETFSDNSDTLNTTSENVNSIQDMGTTASSAISSAVKVRQADKEYDTLDSYLS